jgi:hypothetical protein
MRRWLWVLITAWIPGTAPASEGGTPPRGATVGWERYQVLVQRNVFAKDRGRAREEAKAGATSKPEADTVLTGILEKDGELIAFLENRKTKAVQVARKDDPVARGRIGAISLDSIEYLCDGASVRVEVGKSLEGGAAEPARPAATGSGADSGSTETNAILERLRKRHEELNR